MKNEKIFFCFSNLRIFLFLTPFFISIYLFISYLNRSKFLTGSPIFFDSSFYLSFLQMCLFFTLNSLLSLYYQSFKLVKIFDRFANLFQSCSFYFLFLFAIQFFFFVFFPFFPLSFFLFNYLNRSKFLTGSSFFTVFFQIL